MRRIPGFRKVGALFLFAAAAQACIADHDLTGNNAPPLEAVERHVPLALDFHGPTLSETGDLNPFTDYRLTVTFQPPAKGPPIAVRGFYAADGNAAESGAVSGPVWRAMFTPDRLGEWQWEARLSRAPDIAIDRDFGSGETVDLSISSGQFEVVPSSVVGTDWRAENNGRLLARDGKFIRSGSDEVWLKSGANSPENLLAFVDFDNTYRIGDNARDGESDGGNVIHSFAPHGLDWKPGDPEWGVARGRNLIGALNYLAGQGVNAVYFLTWNVGGDGKDVWPFLNPDDPTRFDVSKLDQWESVFSHMQSRGIALHVVLQETENELAMDEGNTGRIRKLYMAEMVARYAHHNALIWNLGEENGPVHWRPEGQDDAQRQAMIDWLSAIDPYDHPVLLHTHAESADKDRIAGPLLGYPGLDGLSLQVSDRTDVYAETVKWARLSQAAGRPWLISMDEIGPWQDGAVPDNVASDNHSSLIRHALWGHLLAGGSGVEWYFGAHHDHNDLSAENFRSRERLWRASSAARKMLAEQMDLGSAEICDESWTVLPCLSGPSDDGRSDIAIVYVAAGQTLDKTLIERAESVQWRDPLSASKAIEKTETIDGVALIYGVNFDANRQ